MVHKRLRVRRVKVRWERLWEHWAHLLRQYFRLRLEPKCFVCFLISGLSVKRVRLILGQPNDWRWLADSSQHLILFFQFLLLFLVEWFFVSWLPFEWKRIKWILRLLLMVNIILTVLPIWERFSVSRLIYRWFELYECWFSDSLFGLDRVLLVDLSVDRGCVNPMRVYNFSLFFQIESIALPHHKSLPQIVIWIFLGLLVSWLHILRIWVSHEFIGTSSDPSPLVTSSASLGVLGTPCVHLHSWSRLTSAVASIPVIKRVKFPKTLWKWNLPSALIIHAFSLIPTKFDLEISGLDGLYLYPANERVSWLK